MSIRSLNGLAGSSTTNVYVNTIDVFTGTSPIVVAQTSANQPVDISLKDINGFGGAGKILQINTTNDGLIWSDDPYENITVSLPLERTADNIALKGLSTMGAAGKIIKVNSLGTELEYADEDGSNWTVSGSNIYPITATQLLVNTTTNTNNRNLLINGDGEITTNLYLSGGTSQIQIDSNSSSGLFFNYTTNAGFKFFADHTSFGSPHLNNESNNIYLFRISLTNTIKHRFLNGTTEIYSNSGTTDTTKNYFVKASNTNIGNYIQNDFTNNLFQLRRFTQSTDEYFLQYDTTNQELRIPDKLILGAGSSQLSNGTYNYTLPNGSGTLATISDIPTYTAQSPIQYSNYQFSLTTVPYNLGGTGQTGYSQGDMIYAIINNSLTKLSIGSSGQVLKVQSGGNIPVWEDETVKTATTPLSIIANDISLGTVPTQKGGTGFTSYAGGQLIYGSVGIGPPNALSLLNIGNAGQVLKVSSGAPAWQDEVSYTALSPLTVVGTQFQLTTVPYNLGGTGQSSWVQGDILYASANNVLSKLGIGNTGQVLQVNTAGTLPEWASFSGASKWSVGDSGLSTEFIYPTTTSQRVVIGRNPPTNPNDYQLRIEGESYTNGEAYIENSTENSIKIIRSGTTGITWYDTETNARADTNRKGYIQTNTSAGDLTIHGSNSIIMDCGTGRIFMNDYVGFTSSTANYPIEVGNYQNTFVGTTGFMRYIVSANSFFDGVSAQTTRNVSIRTVGDVWVNTTNQSVIISSDRRIKTNIENVPDNFALDILRQIPTRQYEYIDKLTFGNQKQIGFIAQEVKEVMPNAVQSEGQDELIADVFKIINCKWNGNKMSSTDLPNIVSGIEYKFTVSNTIDNEDEKEIVLVGNEDNTFTFDNQYTTVFCYGSKVKDFHTIDYGKLHTLNFSATQQLDKIQQTHITKIASLEAELNTYKAIVDKLVKATSFKAFKESLA